MGYFRKYVIAFALVLLSLGLVRCNNQATSQITPEPFAVPLDEAYMNDPSRNFVLFVSNQSFDITPVDIKVLIDDIEVVNSKFDVGNQHNYYAYRFNLSKGKHRLQISSKQGETNLDEEFEVTDVHWSVIDFWYYPDTHPNPTPKHFSWHIQDKPISFQ